MTTIVVAPPHADIPASRALRMEGIDHRVERLREDDAYARLLTRMWRRGEAFTIVEADVVPWPGALAALWACPELWCGYRYPLARGSLDGGLGCVHFREDLLRQRPNAPALWAGAHWQDVDLLVRQAINGDRRKTFHIHVPPVAHARERRD